MMLLLFAVVFVFSIYGSSRINIDTDFYKRFRESSRTRKDEKYYHQHFAGANFLEVFIDAPEADGVLDPQVFTNVVEFQRAVERMDEVDEVLSLVNLIDTIDREMNPEYRPGKMTQWTRGLLAQYLLLFESSGGEDLDRVVDFERKTLRMNIRLAENGTQCTYNTAKTIQQMADEIIGDGARVEITGIMYLLGAFVDDVVTGQKRGLVFGSITIMFMMIFIFRSIRTGLWSMVPNLLPLITLGGYLGYFWNAVDSDTIIIAMVAIGIGVDDTIHFLSRLRFESVGTSDSDQALQRSFHFSGRAMVTTTIILTCGFLPLGLSDYFTVGIFGTLLPMTLIVAVMGDILLVPALVKLEMIRFPSGTGSRLTENMNQA
jgi:predicted RND superfamily exporter protein